MASVSAPTSKFLPYFEFLAYLPSMMNYDVDRKSNKHFPPLLALNHGVLSPIVTLR